MYTLITKKAFETKNSFSYRMENGNIFLRTMILHLQTYKN